MNTGIENKSLVKKITLIHWERKFMEYEKRENLLDCHQSSDLAIQRSKASSIGGEVSMGVGGILRVANPINVAR